MKIYHLNDFPEEVISHAFAKTSRSDGKFLEMAQGLNQEKSSKFHEKWVLQYGHACYDENTDVLTDKGWLNFPELVKLNPSEIKLASLNPDTNLLEYISPIKFIAQYYEGDMYYLNHKHVNLLTTPNHRMWVCKTSTKQGRNKTNFSLVRADEIINKSYAHQVGGALWQGKHTDTITIADKKFDANPFLNLIGFFIGDGYVDKIPTRGHHAIEFHLKKERKITFLKEILQKCPEIRLYEGKGHRFRLYCNGLGTFMKACYNKNRQKIIPQWLLTLSQQNLKALYNGLRQSDGNVADGEHATPEYFTTSKPLAEQMIELSLKLGYSCKIKKSQTTFSCFINRNLTKPHVNKLKKDICDQFVPFAGNVYCAELPKNHILYVKRAGKPVFCGNSVSEHSVIHIAVEGVSRAVVEELESGRLASYTEQSTRYQTLQETDVYFDENWNSNFKSDYRLAMKLLFELYNELLVSENGTQNFDVARFALPLGALVNVGMTINMRSLRHTICKLLASNMLEAKELAEQLIEICSKVAPTLLKHVKPCAFTTNIKTVPIKGKADQAPTQPIHVVLASSSFDISEILEAATIVAGGKFGQSMLCKDLIPFLCNLQEHDSISRAFEYSSFKFIITSDYGSYYDMKRHRMATVLPENGFILNFVKPAQLTSADYLSKRYYSVMQQVADIYKRHSDKPEAKYMLPNAVQKRYSMQMNARELAEIIRLRGFNPDGHPTYRAIGLLMYELASAKYPIMDWLETRRKDSHTSETIIAGYKLLNNQ